MKGYSFQELVKLAEAAVKRAGDTMTGDLTTPKVLVSGAQGTEANALTRKDYVDSRVATAAPTTHTHTAAQGNADIVASGHGQIGTYAMLGRFDNAGQISPGGTIAGSNLRFSNADGTVWGPPIAGTWKALGYVKGDSTHDGINVTLFIRIA